MITDDEIKLTAQAFAQVIKPDNGQRFIEDFTMGAIWMRRKMREYELQQDNQKDSGYPPAIHTKQDQGKGTLKRS